MSFMDEWSWILGAIFVFLAGFIDSIAGGGGLITVPVFSLLIKPGAEAIGTNKIIGLVSAVAAMIVYWRKGGMPWREALVFCIAILIGSFLGARVSIWIPAAAHGLVLLLACPIILWISFNKLKFIGKNSSQHKGHIPVLLSGILVGFYDGAFGPGGGTFMLLALNVVVGLPLIEALAASKLANSVSAGVSLATYAFQGVVHWTLGLSFVLFSVIGALLGSRMASRDLEKYVRRALVIISVLLILKVIERLIH